MGLASKACDWAFKAFTASLGVATVYLAATFSVNVYRGLSWHNAQSKIDKQDSIDQGTAGEEQRANETLGVTLSFAIMWVQFFCLQFYSDIARMLRNNRIGGALFRS